MCKDYAWIKCNIRHHDLRSLISSMHDENCGNGTHLLQSPGLAGALVVVGDARLAAAASVLHQHQSNVFQACPLETGHG